MKRNKIRYQSKVQEKILITLTGKVYLRYDEEDELAMQSAAKGDLLAYPQNTALNSTRCGDYGSTGFSGYFKLDVFDGKNWQPLILNEFFLHNENHFSKSECPIDTYDYCVEILQGFIGKSVQRTYREHYELA